MRYRWPSARTAVSLCSWSTKTPSLMSSIVSKRQHGNNAHDSEKLWLRGGSAASGPRRPSLSASRLGALDCRDVESARQKRRHVDPVAWRKTKERERAPHDRPPLPACGAAASMSVLQALVLGIVQGLCEFIPISSSGHLILVPWLFGWNFFQLHPDLNKTFDVALHLGTFIAAVVYFWRQIVTILRAWVHSLRTRRIETADERLAWLLLISTIPAGLVGVAFESFVEDQLGKPYLICIMMIAFALVMLLADRIAKLNKSMSDLRWPHALGIGVAQA